MRTLTMVNAESKPTLTYSHSDGITAFYVLRDMDKRLTITCSLEEEFLDFVTRIAFTGEVIGGHLSLREVEALQASAVCDEVFKIVDGKVVGAYQVPEKPATTISLEGHSTYLADNSVITD